MSGGKFECSGLSAENYSRAYGTATSPPQNKNQWLDLYVSIINS